MNNETRWQIWNKPTTIDDEIPFKADEDTRPMTRYDPQMELIGQRAELERLRKVEQVARELAKFAYENSITVEWACEICHKYECGKDCLITRSRALGLLAYTS